MYKIGLNEQKVKIQVKQFEDEQRARILTQEDKIEMLLGEAKEMQV